MNTIEDNLLKDVIHETKDEDIKEKLITINSITNKIIKRVNQSPSLMENRDLDRFFNFYLPKVVENIEQFNQYNDENHDRKQVKDEIINTLDEIENAVISIWTIITNTDMADITTELKAIRTMLSMEGYSSESNDKDTTYYINDDDEKENSILEKRQIEAADSVDDNSGKTVTISKKRIAIFACIAVLFIVGIFIGLHNNVAEEKQVAQNTENNTNNYSNEQATDNMDYGTGNQPTSSDDLEIVDTGFHYKDGVCRIGYKVKNNGDDYDGATHLRLTAKDKSGDIVGAEENGEDILIKSNENGEYAATMSVDGVPDSVEVELGTNYYSYNVFDHLDTDKVKIKKGEYHLIATGEVVNNTDNSYDIVAVHIIFRDKNNKIVGAHKEYVSSVKPNSKTAFSIEDYSDMFTNNFTVNAIGHCYD